MAVDSPRDELGKAIGLGYLAAGAVRALARLGAGAQLAEVGRARLRVEPLPAYAPELNPDEGIWSYLKRVELRNVRCQDLAHLEDELRRAATRLRRKRPVLRACVRQVGYAV